MPGSGEGQSGVVPVCLSQGSAGRWEEAEG